MLHDCVASFIELKSIVENSNLFKSFKITNCALFVQIVS